jgi:hypothetical protein
MAILASAPECDFDKECKEDCSFREENEENIGRSMLIWVSPDNYPTPEDFLNEAGNMGISRRISGDQIPRGLIVGKTWIFLAHREVVFEHPEGETKTAPGVFHAFVPEMVEYVVKGSETDAEIANLVKRGITPVQVFNE